MGRVEPARLLARGSRALRRSGRGVRWHSGAGVRRNLRPALHGRHGRTRLHLRHVHEFHVEDEVGFGGNAREARNPRCRRRTRRLVAQPVGQLPGNEDAALASNPHAGEPGVEAGNHTAKALWQRRGLGFHLGFAVGVHDGLAVGAPDGLLVIFPRVELHTVGRAPSGVLEMPELSGFAHSAFADHEVFVVHHEGDGLDGAVRHRLDAWRELDPGRRRGCGRTGGFGSGARGRSALGRRRCGGGWFGWSLGACGERCCRQGENKN